MSNLVSLQEKMTIRKPLPLKTNKINTKRKKIKWQSSSQTKEDSNFDKF
jgi:hypothetical protein